MTPKEKAIELINKFMSIDSDSEIFDGFKMKYFYAQRCALIVIDEMIDFQNNLFIINEGSLAYQYLLQVKQEIEKL